MEIWKEIPNFDSYMASNTGKIKSIDRTIFVNRDGGFNQFFKGKEIKPYDNGTGYMQLNLCINNKKTKHYVHRLVYLTFYGEIPDGFELNHKDHDKKNNHKDNIELVTKSENMNKYLEFYDRQKKIHTCSKCGCQVSSAKYSFCPKCTPNNHIASRKVARPTLEVLEEEIDKLGYKGTGRKYGVSDNAIRKWVKYYMVL